MPGILWIIVAVVFGLPLLVLAGLWISNRSGGENPGRTINLLWALLAVLLAVFLGLAVFSGAN